MERRENPQRNRHGALVQIAVLFLCAFLCALPCAARQVPAQEARLTELERQIESLEMRLATVEGAAEEPAGDLDLGMDLRYGDLLATFQFFGDVGYEWENPESGGEGSSAFELGSLSLLVNAQLGDHFRMLSESAIDVGSDDDIDFSQERLWASWILDDRFYAKLGTEHAPTSRYNQLYHHGRWLETSVSRPLAVRYEGDGGILPLHRTGLLVGGRWGKEAGFFEYFGGVSNGRGAEPTDKQRASDANDGKAIDLGIAFQSSGTSALRVGISGTVDEIPPDAASTDPLRARSLREWIGGMNAEWAPGPLQLRGEVFWIEHEARADGSDFSSQAAYLQAEVRLGDWTPYARLDWREMEEGDPFFASLDGDLDALGPALGVRYDAHAHVAVKLEASLLDGEQRDAGGTVSDEDFATLALQVSWWL